MFAGKVAALYRDGGLTQAKIAEKMTAYGVPTPQVRVSAIIAKPTKFRLNEIEAFAAAYGLTAGYLAFNEGEAGAVASHPKAATDVSRPAKKPAQTRFGR